MPGIYPTKTGYRVIAQIGRGQRCEKAFPAGTPMRTMTRWQEDARRKLREAPTVRTGSLAEDVETYCAARTSMPTATERRRHLELWRDTLGPNKSRHAITSVDVRTALDRWLARGLKPGTVNRRRTALQSFYTVLNGKGGANPVRGVPALREPVLPPRRLDYATFEALLALMPDHGQPTAGKARGGDSQTKARLRVIAYTGLPHAQIAALRPEHLRAEERLLFVKGRKKGAETGDRWLPLSQRGLEAVRALFASGAVRKDDDGTWTGAFSASSMHTSFSRAAAKLGRPELRPYDLRHLFGQTLLRLSKDRASTRDLMLHRSDRTTTRYVASEIPGAWRAALDLFDAEQAG